eukprot:CAMPEP_0114603096 /NCGR_PEP_ID=MMETSP0125-20121206/25562_1 /TAXON_ID=485358 ORGANISM="Aristerostoma sp., Strain ATCC 50986" /NCGR_SAMPLE_ID=MMETSP0125 /ASSEMBLY_ACC=CAM_ASM_000245 /LENGTH=152 /DNA_ID=CAMNT_0001813677 /DNA_START=351 /DNA_END=809 /DNA_ORIENTATION=+
MSRSINWRNRTKNSMMSYTQELIQKVKDLEDQLNDSYDSRKSDKSYYEQTINELKKQLAFAQESPEIDVLQEEKPQGANPDLEAINQNLKNQISEYAKLTKSLHKDESSGGDVEKKRLLDDINTLKTLAAMKQDRIEKLENKVKNLNEKLKK